MLSTRNILRITVLYVINSHPLKRHSFTLCSSLALTTAVLAVPPLLLPRPHPPSLPQIQLLSLLPLALSCLTEQIWCEIPVIVVSQTITKEGADRLHSLQTT